MARPGAETRIFLLLGVLLAAAAGPGAAPARAVHYRVAGETSALVDELQAWDGSLLPRYRVVQQLRLGAHDLAGDGRGQWLMAGSLQVDADFGLDATQLARLEQHDTREIFVPWLYLEGRELWNGRARLTLGRQLLSGGPMFALLDGVRGELLGPFHLGVELYGGWQVRREVSLLGMEDLQPEGSLLGEDRAPIYGASLLLHGCDPLRAQLGYREEREGEDLDRSLLWATALVQPWAWLVLDALWEQDLLAEQTTEAAASLTLMLPAALRWTLQYQRLRPSFPASSVFAWFPAEPVEGWDLHGEARLGRWRVGLGLLLRRPLPEEDGEDAGPERGGELKLGWEPWPSWRLFTGTSLREDHGGTRLSAALGGSVRPARLADTVFEGTLRWVHLTGDQSPWRQGELGALSLSASRMLWERARLQLVAEQETGPWRPWWLRVMALLDLEYWL